jgi:hypothetical protein
MDRKNWIMIKLAALIGILSASIHSIDVSVKKVPEQETIVVIEPQENIKRYVVLGFLGGAATMYVEINIMVPKYSTIPAAAIEHLQEEMYMWLQVGVTQVVHN